MDNLKIKITKLLQYGINQLRAKGIESNATNLREVLDDIGNIEQGNNLLNVIKGINSYNRQDTHPFELTADMFDEYSIDVPLHKYASNRNLIKVTIPNNITTIGSYAFYACSNLIEMHFGSGISTIEDLAFCQCSKMSIMDFRQSTKIPTLSNINVFKNIPTECTFIIPDSLYNEWIASTNWLVIYESGYNFIKASEYMEV